MLNETHGGGVYLFKSHTVPLNVQIFTGTRVSVYLLSPYYFTILRHIILWLRAKR